MGIGTVPAVEALLKASGISQQDIDRFEVRHHCSFSLSTLNVTYTFRYGDHNKRPVLIEIRSGQGPKNLILHRAAKMLRPSLERIALRASCRHVIYLKHDF